MHAYLTSLYGTLIAGLLAVLVGLIYLNRRYKRSEERLRASEERFRDLVETTDAIVWEADARTLNFTAVSANVERLLGYPQADWLLPGFWQDRLHPEDREAAIAYCAERTRRLQNHALEYRFLTREGRAVWLRDEVKVIPEDGHPRWLRGLMVDIEERKRADAELRRMRYSVERAGDSVLWISRDGRILYANEAAWTTLGYTREEILQLTIFDLNPEYEPALWQSRFERLKRLGTVTLETHHRTKQGRLFPIEVSANYVFQDGEEFNFSTVRDITARKAMEKSQLQSLSLMSSTLEATADGILVVNTEGAIEIFNRNFVRMWRIPDDVLASKDDGQAIRFILDQLRDPAQFTEKVGYLYTHVEEESFDAIEFKDGRVFERYSRPQWAGTKVVGRVWSFRDTTARRQAEMERAKLESQLHQAKKLEAVGTLAGGIAHDFNNILSGIYGYLELAQGTRAGDPELPGYLEEIRRAGHRAADLVRQILAFSRTQGGEQAKSPQALDRIVLEAVKLLRAASPSTIEIVTDIVSDPPSVWGNATQLHQVIMNLGTNAIQAIPERTGQVSIELQTCNVDEAQARTLPGLAPGLCLRLTVRDTGAGMDASTRERVFEPFFTTKAPGEGTGLGLSVVHGIVRHHEGAIRLTSEIGVGSQFEIFLPARPAADHRPMPAATVLQPGRGERILIVDDEQAITVTGKRALENLGYRVETENSALPAFARLQRDPLAFRLVVTDQSMPEMTGLELALRLRERGFDLPVLLTSGNSVDLTPDRTQAAGVREVLAKPYTVATLVEAVQRNLGGPAPAAG